MSAMAPLQSALAKPKAAFTPAAHGVLQHKCACGSSKSPLAGMCDDCRSRALQHKLAIGASNDPLEMEADRIADQVMGPSAQHVVGGAAPRIQRFAGQPVGETKTAPASVDQALASPGRPLEQTLRQDMEHRFGHDFSQVRVHADATAERSARDVNANAYTAGYHLVFGAGRFAPGTPEGQQLIAHELVHVLQQSSVYGMRGQCAGDHGLSRVSPPVSPISPASYSLRLIDEYGNEKFIGPPIPDVLDATAGAPGAAAAAVDTTVPEEEAPGSVPLQRMPRDGATPTLFIQRAATFTKPVPKAEDPLVRMMKGLTPGLTTFDISGTKLPSGDQLLTALSPTNVKRTGSSGGNVSCQFDNFNIATTAEQIVATAAPAGGWSATIGPASAISPDPKCAKVAKLPITMNAKPDNADFVKRVQQSEDEHVTDLKWLHDRYLFPYDALVSGLRGSGKDLPACGQDLVGKLGFHATETMYEFVHGWAASVKKFDGPSGTHTDTAQINTNKNCSAATLTVNPPGALKAGAGPGNVAVVNPTVTNFNPAKLTVVGNDIKEGKTLVKDFSKAADARTALAVIQHYGMTSRNVIGSLEYFLVSGAGPSGALKGANEFPIDPKSHQVTFDLPNAGEWSITDISAVTTGIKVNVIASFGAKRDEAYSAWSVLQAFGFTRQGWVGGTRQKPAMTYFRV